MNPRFERDDEKARTNLKKHGVDFEEASTIFDDPLFITFLDEEHSINEERYITIGLSSKQRLLMVAHTESKDSIRIISARKATKNEEIFYAEAG
ncbi:MAG: BrnT family toxin [Anaerolineales bacterium]|nr:BrnT family toxin [Anaerolineales bacterium]